MWCAIWQMSDRKVSNCTARHGEMVLTFATEDFEAAKAKAMKIGAVACYVEDLRKEFIEELCYPAVQCNAIYENVYLLGESLRVIYDKQPLTLRRYFPRSPSHCPLPDCCRTEGGLYRCVSRLHRKG